MKPPVDFFPSRPSFPNDISKCCDFLGFRSVNLTGTWITAECRNTENISPAANASGAGYDVANRIRKIAHNFGTINLFKAYLEISNQSKKAVGLRSELQSAGVCLCDCPHNGGKDVADKMILGLWCHDSQLAR
jgi:hypothetical protein